MKRYNQKLLESNKKIIQSTKKTSQDILQGSKRTVDKLTHPPKKIARIASVIGGTIGTGLVFTSVISFILGRSLLAKGTLSVGVITIASNVINFKNKS